jgi:hypothetical protein
MKRHEARFDHAAAEPRARTAPQGHFIRRGESGGFAELCSDAQLARFEARRSAPQPYAAVELDLAAFLH